MKTIGAKYLSSNRCFFSVWAPEKNSMILHVVYPSEKKISMHKNKFGYFSVEAEGVNPGYRYFYMPEGEKDYPDPASHYQPEGVHGPSEIVDHRAYKWEDITWRGLPLKEVILYEIHTGTFTREGTFEAIIPFLDDIAGTGINAVELMPVSQFPGNRNWGYDGVYPYAVQNSYGGPYGLKKLVDACHSRGIAVFLDVVYNHLGPEGNYFKQFGPYFTKKYVVPWGNALNFDDAFSDGVRDYFSGNPLHWFELYHIDGLRVDAIHMMYDTGAVHFWELTNSKVRELEQKLGRRLYMIAESDFNSPRVVKTTEAGGLGFDAQWLDDFHHALYALLDKEGVEHYIDFGRTEQLIKAFTDGFVHSGEFVKFRKRKHGASSAGISGDKFVVFNQNHDQVGNRVKGERLSVLVDFNRLKIAAAVLLLSPYIPMLFMGEEYAEDSPFFYFVSHSDENLIKAVGEGRKKEFEKYKWKADAPDPQNETTFNNSKLKWVKRLNGRHKIMIEWHKELISLRRKNSALQNFNKNDIRAHQISDKSFVLHRRSEDEQQHFLCLFNLSEKEISYALPPYSRSWTKLLDSYDYKWLDPGGLEKVSTLPLTADAGHNIIFFGCHTAIYTNNDIII